MFSILFTSHRLLSTFLPLFSSLFMSHGLLSTPLLMLYASLYPSPRVFYPICHRCLSTPLLMFSLLFMSRMYRSYNGKAKEAKEIWFLIAEYLEQVKCLVSKSETPLRGCEHLLLGLSTSPNSLGMKRIQTFIFIQGQDCRFCYQAAKRTNFL